MTLFKKVLLIGCISLASLSGIAAEDSCIKLQQPIEVTFHGESRLLDSAARKTLAQIAACAHANPTRKLLITGYFSNDKTSSMYALALGDYYSDTVRKQLISLGVSQARMESKSVGKERSRPGVEEAGAKVEWR